jgi:hypothetical protein
MAKILDHLAFHVAKWLYWHPILTYPNLWAGLTQLTPFPLPLTQCCAFPPHLAWCLSSSPSLFCLEMALLATYPDVT